MRIVFVTESFYPNNAGVPVVTRYLAEGLKEKYGHEVYAVTEMVVPEKEGIYKGIPIFRYDVSYSRGLNVKGDVEGFYNKIVELHPDVLILECAQCVTTDIILPHLHELKCIKILHSHDFSGLWIPFFKIYPSLNMTLATPKNYLMYRLYYNTVLKKYINDFDLLLYISDLGKDKIFFDKYAKVKNEVLLNAANDMFFDTNVRKDQKSNNELKKYCDIKSEQYYICLCNYSGIKNQKKVLEEYYKTKKRNVAMVFMGRSENEYLEKLKKHEDKLIKKYGKREVYYLTGVSRTDIPYILANAEISLTASLWECYSIALIEAMAVGTPFISTDVGNARLLPGGITLTRTNEMHNEIDRMMDDVCLKTRLSEQGKLYAKENCQKDSVVHKLNNLILSLIN